MNNRMKTVFSALAENEAFARSAAAAFVMPLDPTVEELTEIKTAVSEAVTNSIIHGYGQEEGTIEIWAYIEERKLYIEITDYGCGIEDVEKAMEPMFTTGKDGRSGIGFSFMEAFMDELTVESEPGKGTTVKMAKKIGAGCAV